MVAEHGLGLTSCTAPLATHPLPADGDRGPLYACRHWNEQDFQGLQQAGWNNEYLLRVLSILRMRLPWIASKLVD